MNPSNFMITPQQKAALDMQNRLYHQATKQFRYNLAAAPNPVASGVSGTIMNLLGAYLGHGMGGGGNITPNYQQPSSVQALGGYQGGFGGQNFNFGGYNPNTATTGGFNFGGSNVGAQPPDWSNSGFDFESLGL